MLLGLVLTAGAVFYLFYKVVHGGPLSLLNDVGPWAFLAAGLACMAFGLLWRQYQTDIANATVLSVEGTGKKRIIHKADDLDEYCYLIGGMRFEVSVSGYQALVEGVRYRAYYVPHSGELVNIEVQGAAIPFAGVPVCPVCGRSDRVQETMLDGQGMGEATGLFSQLLAPRVLFGKNPVSDEQDPVRQRQRQATLARLPAMSVCRRDGVVFVPGTGKVVRMVELLRMIGQGVDAETIARALGVPPESG